MARKALIEAPIRDRSAGDGVGQVDPPAVRPLPSDALVTLVRQLYN